MQISVFLDGLQKTIDIDVEQVASIATVKSKIQDTEGYPPDQLRLLSLDPRLVQWRKLEDAAHLSHYGIHAGHLLIAQYFLVVSIRLLSGELFVLQMVPSSSIGDVKYMIEEVKEIPPNQQKLIFGTSTMENDKLLSHYGINKEATLTLIVTEADPTYRLGQRTLPYQKDGFWCRNLRMWRVVRVVPPVL